MASVFRGENEGLPGPYDQATQGEIWRASQNPAPSELAASAAESYRRKAGGQSEALMRKGMREAIGGMYGMASSRGANPLQTRAAMYGGAEMSLAGATEAARIRAAEQAQAEELYIETLLAQQGLYQQAQKNRQDYLLGLSSQSLAEEQAAAEERARWAGVALSAGGSLIAAGSDEFYKKRVEDLEKQLEEEKGSSAMRSIGGGMQSMGKSLMSDEKAKAKVELLEDKNYRLGREIERQELLNELGPYRYPQLEGKAEFRRAESPVRTVRVPIYESDVPGGIRKIFPKPTGEYEYSTVPGEYVEASDEKYKDRIKELEEEISAKEGMLTTPVVYTGEAKLPPLKYGAKLYTYKATDKVGKKKLEEAPRPGQPLYHFPSDDIYGRGPVQYETMPYSSGSVYVPPTSQHYTFEPETISASDERAKQSVREIESSKHAGRVEAISRQLATEDAKVQEAMRNRIRAGQLTPEESDALARSAPLMRYEYKPETGLPGGARVGTGARALGAAGPIGQAMTGEVGGMRVIRPDEGAGAAIGMSAMTARRQARQQAEIEAIANELNRLDKRIQSKVPVSTEYATRSRGLPF